MLSLSALRVLLGLFGLVLAVSFSSPLCSFVSAAHNIDAYRLAQFDRGSTAYGSRRSAVNHQAQTIGQETKKSIAASSAHAVDEASSGTAAAAQLPLPEVHRKVLVLPIATATPALIRAALNDDASASSRSSTASALVLVLPRDFSSLSDEAFKHFQSIESYLLTRAWDVPIYFVVEDEYISSMLANLEDVVDGHEASATSSVNPDAQPTDRYHIQVNAPDVTVPLSGVMINHFHGWVHASSSSSSVDVDSLPLVGVFANWDSFAAAPGLASGSDLNASGAVALLEVARLFSRLYADVQASSNKYNIIFVVTGGDRLNFAGTKSWLRSIDSRIIESMDFALCLERLAGSSGSGSDSDSSPLYLHVSKPAKTAELQSLYGRFTSTAAELSIPFEVVHRKINISNPFIYWQHEQLSRKHIVAATLSSSRQPAPFLTHNHGVSILDNMQRINMAVLKRNVRFIVEALVKHVYPQTIGAPNKAKQNGVEASEPMHVLGGGGLDVNAEFIEAHVRLLSSQSRVAALMEDAAPKVDNAATSSSSSPSTNSVSFSNPILRALFSHFSSFTSDVRRQTLTFEQLLGVGSGIGASLTSGLRFYKDKDGGVDATHPRLGVVAMQIFQVKPFMFDVYLAAAITAYLFIIYILCKQPRSVADLKNALIG